MTEILVFGGTSEGRELAEWLSARGSCRAVVCSATEYGGELVSGLPGVDAHVGPLDAEAKEQLVAEHDFACIVDATHPYATHVSESLSALAEAHGLPLLRLVREEGDAIQGVVEEGAFVQVESMEAAARFIAGRGGRVLLTTGSKDLALFTQAVPDFAERVYARVLPVPSSVTHARELGMPAGHIVAMQGPFSTEFNVALMHELSIDVLVTKASGAAGGFPEKIEAAALCGVQVVVVGRPASEEGLSAAEVRNELEARYGA